MCLFVCDFVLYHNVCPDDLTMKDWCHTNNILQVHCWGCLVVQVMFHVLMTSSMTSPGHKVGQILKLIYLRQYLSHPSILGVTLCFCTGSYGVAARAAADFCSRDNV